MIFYWGFEQYIKKRKIMIYNRWTPTTKKMEMLLIVLVGVFLIYKFKQKLHMDDGTIKVILEIYVFYARNILNRIKWYIDKYVLKK